MIRAPVDPLLDLRFLPCRRSHALAAIGHQTAVEAGASIEHHTAIDSAAALDGDLDRLVAALATVAPFDASPLTADASTRSH